MRTNIWKDQNILNFKENPNSIPSPPNVQVFAFSVTPKILISVVVVLSRCRRQFRVVVPSSSEFVSVADGGGRFASRRVAVSLLFLVQGHVAVLILGRPNRSCFTHSPSLI
ncbi:hypothetical protein PIB30_050566, partial [Stylosanthes scabra]|nr:hypothetical protein [Stylosanthes scabra]